MVEVALLGNLKDDLWEVNLSLKEPSVSQCMSRSLPARPGLWPCKQQTLTGRIRPEGNP